MSYSIIYSSRTGNTKMLADTIQSVLNAEECVYVGEPSQESLKADRLYVGFWTDKGRCNDEIADFLKTVTTQEVFLFGTAGFGGEASYFEKILTKTKKYLPSSATVVGTYMCQGKMPMSVRERYEKLSKGPIPNIKMLIENFDKALSHPDADDCQKLKDLVK